MDGFPLQIGESIECGTNAFMLTGGRRLLRDLVEGSDAIPDGGPLVAVA